MWRAVAIIAVLLGAVLFVALNMHTTQVNVPFTKGFEIRTVFLVIVSFALGYGAAHLIRLTRDLKNTERE